MNEYNVSDYGIFDEANATVKKAVSEVKSVIDSIEESKKILSDESVFMGPIADDVKPQIDTAREKTASVGESLNRIGAYFNSVSATYKKGDNDALKNLLDPGSSDNPSTVALAAGVTGTTGSLVTSNLDGKEYKVVDTKVSVDEFFNDIVRGTGLYQSYNINAYADKCLGFATTYAYELYNGKTDMKGSQCDNGLPWQFGFKEYETTDKQEYMNKLYDELSAGRPVVMHVVGNKDRQSRHYVTAVGFNSDVKSAADLKDTDIMIIDSYDGQKESLIPQGSSGNGRYIIQGRDTGGYKSGNNMYDYGYQMFTIPDDSDKQKA